MILITGGAFQGQEDCAKKMRGEGCRIADGAFSSLSEMEGADIVLNLHAWVKRLMEEGEEPIRRAERLFRKNPDAVYTTVEVGSGIVPADPFERDYREAAGRVGCLAAGQAGRVFRLLCGIPTQIK